MTNDNVRGDRERSSGSSFSDKSVSDKAHLQFAQRKNRVAITQTEDCLCEPTQRGNYYDCLSDDRHPRPTQPQTLTPQTLTPQTMALETMALETMAYGAASADDVDWRLMSRGCLASSITLIPPNLISQNFSDPRSLL